MPTGLGVRASRQVVDLIVAATMVERGLLIILDRFTNPWNAEIEVDLLPLSQRANFWMALTAFD